MKITVHQIKTAGGTLVRDTGYDYFESVQPRERYRSSRYNELVLEFSTDTSYRKTEKRINRIRLQTEGAKATTIRNTVEREGTALNNEIQRQAADCLERNGFTADGRLKEGSIIQTAEPGHIEESDVMAAAMELGLEGKVNPADYENPELAVDVSIDDVGVKRQASTRPSTEESKKRKYAYQTVVQINQQESSYTINGQNQHTALTTTMGLLLSGNLLWTNRIVFYMDGETALFSSINKTFGFLPIKIILDWYHLDKKVKERLSSGMAGYKVRNPFLEKIRPLLWNGDVSAAVTLLKSLPEKQIKSQEHIDKLIEYLDRNKPYIPCYAMRSKLGLCNSSNRGEKANDLVVADRQKHNGMSWSREGSGALASICAASHNNELTNWVYNRNLSFSLQKKPA